MITLHAFSDVASAQPSWIDEGLVAHYSFEGVSLHKPMPDLSFPSSRIRETSSSGARPSGFPMVYPVGEHGYQRNVVQSTSLSETAV